MNNIERIENEVDDLYEHCEGKRMHYWNEIHKKKKSYLSKKEALLAMYEYEDVLNRLQYISGVIKKVKIY